MKTATLQREDWEPSNDNNRGLTMRMIENLPIYFQTDDQRINAFLQKNRIHHEMSGRVPTSLNIRMAKGGNGRIRTWLFVCAVAATYLFFAAGSWGWL